MSSILLVDDDAKLLAPLKIALEEAGFRVQTATRLDQAGRIVATEDLDLVVLEVDIEHGSGWDLLRETVDLRRLPVLVLSHRALEEDIVAAFTIGAVDFVSKPYRTNELLARIKARLRDREAAPIEAPLAPAPQTMPYTPPSTPIRRNDERDGALFMPLDAEQTLHQDAPQAEPLVGNLEELPLSQRLHTARQQRRLSLVQIELDTKLRLWYIQAMEEGRFGLLPRGLAAEQMVRTYARYLGIDVDRAAADYRAEYADLPQQPIAYLGGRPEPREIPPWIGVVAAALLALALFVGGIWYFASDQVLAMSDNVRQLVAPPTATPTPTPTLPPTLTPTVPPTLTPTTPPTNTPVPPTNTPVPPPPSPPPPDGSAVPSPSR